MNIGPQAVRLIEHADADEALSAASASFGERSEGCFAIHRQSAQIVAKQLSGPHTPCIEGLVMAQ